MPRNGGSGTIHVTWGQCPSRECESRGWKVWDVVYDEDQFWCGTCERPLTRPIFELHCPPLKAKVGPPCQNCQHSYTDHSRFGPRQCYIEACQCQGLNLRL